MINVCIADDHNLVRNGIKTLLESAGTYRVVAEAQHGQALIEAIEKLAYLPELALIDVSMPIMDGSETTRELKNRFPGIRCVALSHNDDFQNVFKMIDSGARAYLLKDCTPEYLFETLEKVMENGDHFDSFVVGRILEHNRSRSHTDQKAQSVIATLSPKETEFVKICCSEDTYKEIADKMNVSPKTVEGYRVSVFQKLDVTTRVGLVLFAIENGLFEPRKS